MNQNLGGAPQTLTLTLKAKYFLKLIYLFLVLYILTSIVKLLLFWKIFGFSEVISIIILVLGLRSYHFCYFSSFVLFSSFSVLVTLLYLGKMIQNGADFTDTNNLIAAGVLGWSLIVYGYGYIVCFLCYREFKGIYYEDSKSNPRSTTISQGMSEGQGQQSTEREMNNNSQNNDKKINNFTAFSGKGVTLG